MLYLHVVFCYTKKQKQKKMQTFSLSIPPPVYSLSLSVVNVVRNVKCNPLLVYFFEMCFFGMNHLTLAFRQRNEKTPEVHLEDV